MSVPVPVRASPSSPQELLDAGSSGSDAPRRVLFSAPLQAAGRRPSKPEPLSLDVDTADENPSSNLSKDRDGEAKEKERDEHHIDITATRMSSVTISSAKKTIQAARLETASMSVDVTDDDVQLRSQFMALLQ